LTASFERGPVTVTVHDDGSLEVYNPQYAHAISKEWAGELTDFLLEAYGVGARQPEAAPEPEQQVSVPSGEITTSRPRRGRQPKSAS
jgi:hypothetical protein